MSHFILELSDLSNVEAIILEAGFKLHDQTDVEAITFMQQQHYISLFSCYYSDEDVIIYVKQAVLNRS